MYIGSDNGQLSPADMPVTATTPHDARLNDYYPPAGLSDDELALAQAHRMLRFVTVSRGLFPDLRDLADHPGWEIMLQLFVAPHEGRIVSTAELCAITGCWRPLAGRYVELLFERGLIDREVTADQPDKWPLRLTAAAEERLRLLLCGFARGWSEPPAGAED
jgi:hypothetical protein